MPDVFTTLYKPDVLSCLADLSNDEVFTPPSVVNDMLDMLPQELFESPDTTFLDPVCKSGVFLREIAKRLIKGLEDKIPDLQERIDHINCTALPSPSLHLCSLAGACIAQSIQTANIPYLNLTTCKATYATKTPNTNG